jgi:non-ribosomal peptide synthetase component E (peptide arylation enzyme)
MNHLPYAPASAQFLADGLWRNLTTWDYLERHADSHPAREFLSDARRRVSYAQFKNEAERTAQALLSLGIRSGDVVTIQLPNRIEFASVVFSLELVGAVANTISVDLRAREVEDILGFTGSVAYVGPAEFKGFDYAGMVNGMRERLPRLRQVISADGSVADAVNLPALVAAAMPIGNSDRSRPGPQEIVRIAFTSGTTGHPKAATHSFNTMLYAAEVLADNIVLTERDVTLLCMPLGLNSGFLSLLMALMTGSRAVMMEAFSIDGMVRAIAAERVTFLPIAPAALVSFVDAPHLDKFDLSSLRVVKTGGAVTPMETHRTFAERLQCRLIESYGMLETGFHCHTRLDDRLEDVVGTIGRPARGMGLRLLDDGGMDVAPGEVGEVAAFGPSVHLGYLDNPRANAESFTADGWFKTGDYGQVVDTRGTVRIAGRKKEMINRGGKKFMPREIEEIVYQHPGVLHAALVGLPDARLGERNCLCVVTRSEYPLSLEDVLQLLRGVVADYKLPEVLLTLDEMPLTSTGKIQRDRLREQAVARLQPA